MAITDMKMNDFAPAADADYLYAQNSNGDQVKILKSDVAQMIGCFYKLVPLSPGEEYTLPYSNGIIMVQNASLEHLSAIASIRSDNNGSILTSSVSVNFFSKVDGKINVFNTGTNTRYVVKNSTSNSQNIAIRFFKQ